MRAKHSKAKLRRLNIRPHILNMRKLAMIFNFFFIYITRLDDNFTSTPTPMLAELGPAQPQLVRYCTIYLCRKIKSNLILLILVFRDFLVKDFWNNPPPIKNPAKLLYYKLPFKIWQYYFIASTHVRMHASYIISHILYSYATHTSKPMESKSILWDLKIIYFF